MWIDLDYKETSQSDFETRLGNFPFEPSARIASGNGQHVYWFLKKPAGKEEIARVERALKGLAKELGADEGATDASRILRLPGTKNLKYDPPCEVVIEELTIEHEYDLEDFEKHLKLHLKPADSGKSLPTKQANTGSKPWYESLLSGVSEGKRHKSATRLTGRYLKLKLTPEEIKKLLFNWNAKNKPPMSEEEIERIVIDLYNKDQADELPVGPRSLDELEDINFVHGVIDFTADSIVYGFSSHYPTDDGGSTQCEMIIYQQGDEWKVESPTQSIMIGENRYVIDGNSPPPYINDRWSLKDLKEFDKNPTAPDGPTLFNKFTTAFRDYVDLSDDGVYGLLATWALGTHMAHQFPAYPYLLFYGPKETGKSKVLEALSWCCFNAVKMKGITVAAMGDTLEGLRGTLLLDQAEALSDDLIGYLADSYKKVGGKRTVIQIVGGVRSTLKFNTYGPKAFATTKNLDPDLLDRCCKIGMVRTSKQLPDLEGWEPIWPELRSDSIRWLLLNYRKVKEAFSTIPSTGTRLGELWRPMEAVLKVLDVGDTIIKKTKSAFERGMSETRTELTEWEEALFEAVKSVVESQPQGQEVEIDSQTLLKGVEERIDGDNKPSKKWIGDQISKFSLGTRGPRKNIEKSKVQIYRFKREEVKKLFEKYLRTLPEDETSSCPDNNYGYDSNYIERTEEKSSDTSDPIQNLNSWQNELNF